MSKDYSSESLIDASEDLEWAIESAKYIPVDEHGFQKGTFHVSVIWDPKE